MALIRKIHSCNQNPAFATSLLSVLPFETQSENHGLKRKATGVLNIDFLCILNVSGLTGNAIIALKLS